MSERVVKNNFLSLICNLDKAPKNLDDAKFSKKVKKGLLTVEKDNGARRYLVFIKKDKDGNETKIVLDEILGDESGSKFKFGVGGLFNVNKLFTYNDNIYGEIGAGRDKLSYLVFSLFSLPTILFSPTLGFSLLGSALIMRKRRVSSVLSLLGILSDAIFPISPPDFIGLFMLLASLYMAKKGTSSNKITKVYNSLGDIGSKYLPFDKALLVSNLAYLNSKYSEVTEELGDDTGTVIYSPLIKVISIRIKKEDGSYFSPLLFDDLLDNSAKLLSKVKVKFVGYERMDPFINFRFKIDPKDKKNLLNKLLSIEKKGKKVTLAEILSLSLGFSGESGLYTYLGDAVDFFTGLNWINGQEIDGNEVKIRSREILNTGKAKVKAINETKGIIINQYKYKDESTGEEKFLVNKDTLEKYFSESNLLEESLLFNELGKFYLIYRSGKFYVPVADVGNAGGRYSVLNYDEKEVGGLLSKLIIEGKVKVKLIGTYLHKDEGDKYSLAYVLEVKGKDVKKEVSKVYKIKGAKVWKEEIYIDKGASKKLGDLKVTMDWQSHLDSVFSYLVDVGYVGLAMDIKNSSLDGIYVNNGGLSINEFMESLISYSLPGNDEIKGRGLLVSDKYFRENRDKLVKLIKDVRKEIKEPFYLVVRKQLSYIIYKF